MANSFDNPIIIDTAEGSLALPIFRSSKPLSVKRVVWKNPTNVGDALLIKDALGNVIVNTTCEVANQSQSFFIEHAFDGLFVPTITSGTAFIYLN